MPKRSRVNSLQRLMNTQPTIKPGASNGGFESAGFPESAPVSTRDAKERCQTAEAAMMKAIEDYYGADDSRRDLLREYVNRTIKNGKVGFSMVEADDEERLNQNPEAVAGFEAIVRNDGSRPSFLVKNGQPDPKSSPVGEWASNLEKRSEAIREAIASVGRIDTPGQFSEYQGTGFLIARNLIVTNRHVLQMIARPQSDGSWKLLNNVAIDFGHEFNAPKDQVSQNRRKLKRVIFAGAKPIDFSRIDHAKLDFALIELEPTDKDFKPKPFLLQSEEMLACDPGAVVFTIGYPGEPPEQVYPPTLLDLLFRKTYGHKRFAPGLTIESQSSRLPWTLAHDATTLGGNSGSTVVAIGNESIALGLHYGGRPANPAENWCHRLGNIWGETDGRAKDTLFEVLIKHGVPMSGPTPQPRIVQVAPAPATEGVPFIRSGWDSAESVSGLTTAQRSRLAERVQVGGVSSGAAESVNAGGSVEIVFGRSNFLPVSFLAVGTATSRATAIIRASGTDYRGRVGSWSGTGFLLSPNILLTNHHVLNSPAVASASSAIFNFQLEPDGRPGETQSFRLMPERLFLTSPTVGGLDYTFCWIDGLPGRTWGVVRASRRTFPIAEGEFANIVSHPAGRMKEVALQENLVRWQDDLVVHYECDTEPGSSGAAVCNNNWDLVALHHASQVSASGRTLNEGIKLAAIATDLERQDSRMAREVLSLFGGTDERLGFFGRLGRQPVTTEGVEAVVDSFTGTEQDLDVGFWNVEWLSNRYPAKAAAVAKVIRDMNLDLWALEESSPAASKELLKELNEIHGLDYAELAAEPDKPDDLQSCTVLWNKATVHVEVEPWGEEIDVWLKTHSRDFDELGLGDFEAVEGKIFDRYPALFRVKSLANGPAGAPLEFYFVPLHLKAMSEGSKRRKMASRILAAAAAEKAQTSDLKDFIFGGDANAPLGSGDFANLTEAGLVAVSAEDAESGAFSYIKGPQSLIDHVFISPNLATTVPTEFFIVAAENTIPDYVQEISDHCPVLLRMSMGSGSVEGRLEATAKSGEALERLKMRIRKEPRNAGERARRGEASSGEGYDPNFLGSGNKSVLLPRFTDRTEPHALVVNRGATGFDKYILPYTHFSVVMNATRRLLFYSAVNIDGTKERNVPELRRWHRESRIPADAQVGNEFYTGSGFSRGHMTRRLDPIWGSPQESIAGEDDTHAFTNAVPQMQAHNGGVWLQLEDYVLRNAQNKDFKASVITGPVFRDSDGSHKDVQIPKEFWKVAAMLNTETGKLSITGYLQSQEKHLPELEFVYGEFKTYQVPLRKIATLTGLDFDAMLPFDPLQGDGGLEAADRAVEITGPESLVL